MMEAFEIGHVLRASTEGFTFGTRSQDVLYPTFGAFVQSYNQHSNDDLTIVGVITSIKIQDDPLVRQLIMASDMNPAAVRDQRVNRLVPVEIDVLSIAYVQDARLHNSLPPRPPLSLDPVMLCNTDQIYVITQQVDFFRLILSASGVPNNVELLAAVVRSAADARPDEERVDFLVNAGRHLAGLLGSDLQMLKHALQLIRP